MTQIVVGISRNYNIGTMKLSFMTKNIHKVLTLSDAFDKLELAKNTRPALHGGFYNTKEREDG
jgi:hypothetical protein